jgi:molybdenum cofactor synthesis domain-containing protein
VEISRIIVSDDSAPLTAALEKYRGADIILTTGGTGLGPRDISPEVCRRWCDKEVPGIAEALRAHSLAETSSAMLSRGFAGLKDTILVINLPGSVKAVTSCTRFLLPVLPHAVKMIRGEGH